jgi:hypothetical protein
MVNDDPNRIVEFSPSDLAFVERFYKLLADFQEKRKGYVVKAESIDANGGSITEGVSLLKEMCDDFRAGIDTVFGAGTSQAAFEDACTLDMFEQFFKGITPIIDKKRTQKMDKYLAKAKDEILK